MHRPSSDPDEKMLVLALETACHGAAGCVEYAAAAVVVVVVVDDPGTLHDGHLTLLCGGDEDGGWPMARRIKGQRDIKHAGVPDVDWGFLSLPIDFPLQPTCLVVFWFCIDISNPAHCGPWQNPVSCFVQWHYAAHRHVPYRNFISPWVLSIFHTPPNHSRMDAMGRV
jgi:hypothetical protein